MTEPEEEVVVVLSLPANWGLRGRNYKEKVHAV